MTIRTEFSVNTLPGKIVFTPGGRYGVMINQTPGTGSAVISIELPTGIIAVASPTVPVILNTLTVASAGRIYATSNQTRALYEILVEPLRIRTATFPNIASPTNVVAVATTNEWLNPDYVLVATSNSILRLNNGYLPPEGAGGFSISSAPGNLVFAAPGVTGQPAVITSYNVDQTTAPGTTYLPLVTRVFTFSGRPIYGVPVTFTSEDPTAIISAPTVITNYEGYALTSVTAPGNAASFSVTALTGTSGSP